MPFGSGKVFWFEQKTKYHRTRAYPPYAQVLRSATTVATLGGLPRCWRARFGLVMHLQCPSDSFRHTNQNTTNL